MYDVAESLPLKQRILTTLKRDLKIYMKILIKRHMNYRLVLIFIFSLFPQWVGNQAWEEVGERTNQVLFLTTILFRNLVNHLVAGQSCINQAL